MLAFKAVTAGDTTAASVDGKGLSSGSYTFWKDAGAGVGEEQVDTPAATTVQACLNACDNDFDCAAVVMTSVNNGMDSTGVGCKLVKGNKTIAQFKRSVTKAVASRLAITAATAP